jgi:hypothetical protein
MVTLEKVFIYSGVRYLFQRSACQGLDEVGFMNPHIGCSAVAKIKVLLHLLHTAIIVFASDQTKHPSPVRDRGSGWRGLQRMP